MTESNGRLRASISNSRLDEFVGYLASSFDLAIVELLAKPSLSVPHRPLGSAAETVTPASIMLSKTLAHSSGVKFCLFAMATSSLTLSPMRGRVLAIRALPKMFP